MGRILWRKRPTWPTSLPSRQPALHTTSFRYNHGTVTVTSRCSQWNSCITEGQCDGCGQWYYRTCSEVWHTHTHTHSMYTIIYRWYFSLILRYIRNFLPPGGCAHRGTSRCREHPAFPPSHSHPSTPHRLRVQRAREHDGGEERALCWSQWVFGTLGTWHPQEVWWWKLVVTCNRSAVMYSGTSLKGLSELRTQYKKPPYIRTSLAVPMVPC